MRLRVFFDVWSGEWADDDEAQAAYGYPVPPEVARERLAAAFSGRPQGGPRAARA